MFLRGDTIIGPVFIAHSNGTANNHITIGAYGTGANPIITIDGTVTGWNASSNWTNVGDNIWYMSYNSDTQGPGRMWLGNTEYTHPQTLSGIDQTSRWYYNDTTKRFYVYATSNPATFYTDMQCSRPSTDFGNTTPFYIYIGAYFDISDLNIVGGTGNRFYGSNHITVRNCSMGYNGTGALVLFVVDDCLLENCIFDSNDHIKDTYYRRDGDGCGDGVILYESGSRNIIRYNTFKDWGHNSLNFGANTDGSVMQDNKAYGNYFNSADVDYNRAFGAGKFGTGGRVSGNEFYYNYIEHHAAPIQLDMPGFKFHHNIINQIYNSIPGGPSGASAAIGFGVVIQGYNNTHPHDIYVYNNVFANCDEAGFYYNTNPGGTTPDNNYVINNIFYNCGRSVNDGNAGAQLIINNNNGVGSLIVKNNIFFKPGVTNLIANGHWGPYQNNFRTVAQFNSDNGLSGDTISGNLNEDPLFVNPSIGDFTLQEKSPALANATNTGVYLDKGLSPNSSWPLGIIELPYNSQFDIGPYVNSANLAPAVNAGNDQSVTLPVNSVNLAGSTTNANGTATSYLWTQIAGPATAIITNPNAEVTSVTGLTKGIYQFQFTVSPINNSTVSDTMQVVVTGATLPATGLTLLGKVASKTNILEWVTQSEQNNLGFEVEQSTNTYNFSKIAFQPTKGVNGNSSTTISYYQVHESPQKGTNYYRLKQIDKDGKFTYSNIVELKNMDADIPWSITLYPNPAANVLNVKSTYFDKSKILFLITDVKGKTVVNKVSNISPGESITKIDISNLSSGTYFLTGILTNSNKKLSEKFEKL